MDLRYRLWGVMAGVSLLLVVVLAGGLYWLRPAAAGTGDGPWPRSGRAVEPFQYVSAAAPGAPVAPTVEVAAPAAAGSAATTESAAAAGPDDARARRPAAQPAPSSNASEPVTETAARPDARQPAAPTVEREAAPAATPDPVARKPAAQPAPAPARSAAALPLRQFWIQVGSFVSHSRALALGTELTRRGLENRITTRAADSTVFYRVRVGPYSSRMKAERSLDAVRSVDGLDGSYVTEVATSA